MMTATPDCSIVIPTIGRDSLRWLLAALEQMPGIDGIQIIVVDDRPKSPSELVLESEHPLVVLRSGGRGPAAARNVGWRAATSRWVAFLDDDVLPHPYWLRW